MTQDIHFLAPLPAMRKRTRLAKMVPVLRDSGHQIWFYGWERVPGEAREFAWGEDGVRETTLMRGGGYASGKARAMYPLWMTKVFWQTLRLGRGKLLFCLGWETAFPALLAASFTGSRIVFDDADRFSMIVRLPGIAGSLLRVLERWASRRAELHVIPGFSRYESHHDKMFVLRNSPLEEDFLAATRAVPSRPDASLVLYANGWIGETRGAPIFLRLLDLAAQSRMDLKIVIAGRYDGAAATRLISHPQAIYLGELSQREALAWYGACDAVLTYYDPAVPINRKAESNKWGDAVFFGCPIIVNSEVETAAPLVEAQAAISMPYSDAQGLLDRLREIAPEGELRASIRNATKRLRPEFPVFDHQLKHILRRLTLKEQD
ncbi:hypothetical protein OS190_09030 [Sulfitobacter sp. F26204]|uniref:hypothetical protein n=1 Tax=Sulfitobacter sp. F26204 TaxID=2996014 RepID=UPI00225E666F|nr:hypothetical protein [Sulfitobacter sp. F26204]MCX7559708.1 hypothetical protein [Sulfitobacter sp. F26204]